MSTENVVSIVEQAGLVAGESNRLSATEIRSRVNLVQTVMQGVMKRDTHYGTIPGTPKPTLYKPGAEVLCVTFRVAQKYHIEDLSTNDCARYRVTCAGIHQTTGIVLGEGVGECSSNEEKYKWRAMICKAEFDGTPETHRRIKYYKNGGTANQVRTEPADIANTVLKMACKRAMIAMTLNVTAASDIFTQDIEDLPEELREFEDSPRRTTATDTAKAAATVELTEEQRAEIDLKIIDLEQIAKNEGLLAFREAWKALSESDKAAITIAERNRIDALAKAAEAEKGAANE